MMTQLVKFNKSYFRLIMLRPISGVQCESICDRGRFGADCQNYCDCEHGSSCEPQSGKTAMPAKKWDKFLLDKKVLEEGEEGKEERGERGVNRQLDSSSKVFFLLPKHHMQKFWLKLLGIDWKVWSAGSRLLWQENMKRSRNVLILTFLIFFFFPTLILILIWKLFTQQMKWALVENSLFSESTSELKSHTRTHKHTLSPSHSHTHFCSLSLSLSHTHTHQAIGLKLECVCQREREAQSLFNRDTVSFCKGKCACVCVSEWVREREREREGESISKVFEHLPVSTS